MLALAALVPGLTAADAQRSWSALGLDSFDLLSLRLAVEETLGIEISDRDWVDAASPAQLAELAASTGTPRSPRPAASLSLTETIEIAMPQMALCGLSESWLLKALGDVHWRLVGQALEVRPVDICDSFGNRLYPSFTRLRFTSSCPLRAFEEGEQLELGASLSRYGAAIFFSDVLIRSESGRTIRGELMSSFVCRERAGRNGRLLRAQPALPHCCAAPAHAEMPPFGIGYERTRRGKDRAKPILAKGSYELLPHYDINGVGLLYYAAYPMIADICQMRSRGGAAWAAAASTVERDICYFANADPGAALDWRLHRDAAGDGFVTEASITRDDGVLMALVATRKASV